MGKMKIIREIPSKIKEIKDPSKSESELERELKDLPEESPDFQDVFFGGSGSTQMMGSENIKFRETNNGAAQPLPREEDNPNKPRGQVYEAAVGDIERREANYRLTSQQSESVGASMAPLRRTFSRSGDNLASASPASQDHVLSQGELTRKYEAKEEDMQAERQRRRLPWER